MKRILFILIFSLIILTNCTNNKTNEENDFFNEVEQIDTTNIIELHGIVIQTLHENECLMLSNFETYYYVSSNMIYDRMEINDSVYFCGTYTYLGKDSSYHTVPVYLSKCLFE